MIGTDRTPRMSRSALVPLAIYYWRESQRPLVSLAFVLPLLVVYEGGVLWLGPAAMRNGADVWLRQLLDLCGLSGYFLLPILTVGVLIGWHHTTHDRWQISMRVLAGMLAESTLLGLVLLTMGHLQWHLLACVTTWSPPVPLLSPRLPAATAEVPWLSKLVSFAGAGVYEEVLFRLLLVPLMAGLVGLFVRGTTVHVVGAILFSSLIFAAAHYVAPHGEVFNWFSFVFRGLAGSFFALLFVFRGFGIAAGCHGLYDILVGIL